MAKGCWILTTEYNDHDQYGEYFCAVWQNKPKLKQLADYFEYNNPNSSVSNVMAAVSFLEHILSGGGRKNTEHQWYNLTFIEYKDN